MCENSAIGILGEIGPKNYRINGTYGLFYGDKHRFKVGGEYLGQKLHYRFLTGKDHRWINQYAVGGKYQYLVGCCGMFGGFLQGFQVSGYYSHAQSRTPRSIFFPNQNFTIFRHVAGGQQWNAEGGIIIRPWACATLIGTVGYDEFRFHRHFNNRHRHYSGVSGTLYFNQRLWRQFAFDVKAEFRRAYNYVEGMLSWNRTFNCGELTLGVFGSHTWGNNRLPSVSTAGGELRYAFGVEKSCIPCECSCYAPTACPSELSDWVASPAVYMPQVFAVSESSVCPGPTSTPFPLNVDGVTFEPPLGFSAINLATNFTDPNGNPLNFTASDLPPGVSLQPNGVLYVNNDGLNPGTFDITVTATSECGSTSQPITLLIEST